MHVSDRLRSFDIGRDRVCDDELIEFSGKLDMRIMREDTMWSEGSYRLRSASTQHPSRLSESPTSLDEIIDDDDIFTFGISFLDRDLPLFPFPAHLDTDDTISVIREVLREALRCTIVRKGDDCIGRELEERECCMELSIYLEGIEEKPLHERVDVECMERSLLLAS